MTDSTGSVSKVDLAIAHIDKALRILADLQGRDVAMVKTKLDEALLWTTRVPR